MKIEDRVNKYLEEGVSSKAFDATVSALEGEILSIVEKLLNKWTAGKFWDDPEPMDMKSRLMAVKKGMENATKQYRFFKGSL